MTKNNWQNIILAIAIGDYLLFGFLSITFGEIQFFKNAQIVTFLILSIWYIGVFIATWGKHFGCDSSNDSCFWCCCCCPESGGDGAACCGLMILFVVFLFSFILIPNLTAFTFGLLYANHVVIQRISPLGLYTFYKGSALVGFVISYIVEVERRKQYAQDHKPNSTNIDYAAYYIKPYIAKYIYMIVVALWVFNECAFAWSRLKPSILHTAFDTILVCGIYAIILKIQYDAIMIKPFVEPKIELQPQPRPTSFLDF